MINSTVIQQQLYHTVGYPYQGTSSFEAYSTSPSLAASTSKNQEMSTSKQANIFECTVNALLMQIQEKNPEFTFKFDKWKQMKGECIQRGLIRKTDGEGSNPDAEAYYNGKLLCIDAKNYAKAQIDLDEVTKLVGDTQVRRGCPGILVLQKNSCLDEKAYKECKKRHIVIVQLESIPTENEHSAWNMNYFNDANQAKLEKALTAQFTEVPKVDVLFTMNGYVDRRSKACRNGYITREQLEEFGVRFIEGTDKVDKRCSAFRKYKEHQNVLQQKKDASNYSHKTATTGFEERKETKQKDKELKGDRFREEESKINRSYSQNQTKEEVKYNDYTQTEAEKERKYQEYIQRKAENEQKHQEYLQQKAEKDRKHQEYLQRQAEKERKHQEYLQREAQRERRKAEKEREHQEYLQRQAEKERKHKEYLQRQAEKERKHKEYLQRQAEKEKKHQEYLQRQAKREQKQKEYISSGSYSGYSKTSGNFSSYANPGYSSNGNSSYGYSNVARNPTGPMKSNGTPDMRYSGNREVAHLTKSGAPDMRFKCNK